jgi:CDP-diacylglycerol--serine O-phosphatidyltransferase
MAGLVLAFWSLTLVVDGRYEAAVWAIFAAGLADTLDGAVARAVGSISPLGKQLDSLVDLVAAGVAPAFLVYEVYFRRWGAWGVLMAFTWVAFVAVRLARFNTASLVQGHFFVGVPCPIGAAVLAQLLLFNRATFGSDGPAWVVAVLIVVLGALMLSRVPYWKSATLMPRSFFHYWYGPLTFVTFLALIPFPDQAIFVGTSFSLVCAVGKYLRRGAVQPAVEPAGATGVA